MPERLRARLQRWLRSRGTKPSPKIERMLLAIAAVVFVVAAVIGILSLPPLENGVRWLPLLVLALVGPPGMVVLNSAEYLIMGRLLGIGIPLPSAVRVSLVASAANLLPIPGAALVRIRALRQQGVGLGPATSTAATIGAAWLGVTGLLAGGFQFPSGRWELGTGLVAGGLAALALASILARLGKRRPPASLMAAILAVESGFVLLVSVQFYLVLLALGFRVSAGQAVAFSVPVVFASAVGFFPGGLGLRELIAAGVGPLVGLPAAVGVVATTIDRLVATLVLGLLATGLLVRRAAPNGERLPAR